jgi:hypothetical protein
MNCKIGKSRLSNEGYNGYDIEGYILNTRTRRTCPNIAKLVMLKQAYIADLEENTFESELDEDIWRLFYVMGFKRNQYGKIIELKRVAKEYQKLINYATS